MEREQIDDDVRRLDADRAKLAAREQEVRSQHADQDAAATEFETRAVSLRQAETKLKQQMEDLAKRTEEFDARQVELSKQREEVESRSSALDLQSENVAQRETELIKQQADVAQQRESLQVETDQLRDRDGQSDDLSTVLVQQTELERTHLDQLRAECNDEQVRLVAEQQKLATAQEEIQAAQDDLKQQKSELASKATEQQQKSVDLRKRATMLFARESAISAGHARYVAGLENLRGNLDRVRAVFGESFDQLTSDQLHLDDVFDEWAIRTNELQAPEVKRVSKPDSVGSPEAVKRLAGQIVALHLAADEQVKATMKAMPASETALLSQLISQRLLSQYQANQLQSGNGADLRVGEYTLIEPLNVGDWTETWKARVQKTGQLVAITRMQLQWRHESQIQSGLTRSWQLMEDLKSPDIIRCYRIADIDNQLFGVFECVRGLGLDQVLKRMGKLDPLVAARIGRSLCRALAAAHEQGMVHRRLSPGRVLIGVGGEVKLTGFGTPKSQHARTSDAAELAYLPAELKSKGKRVDIRSDLYCVGSILFHTLTGRPLRQDAVLTSADGPIGLRSFAAKLLATSPDQRPSLPSVAADRFAQLETLLHESPVHDGAWSRFLHDVSRFTNSP